MRTLVDCGCEAKVHPDGSGVEIYYCPIHASAQHMADLLLSAWEHVRQRKGPGLTTEQVEQALVDAGILSTRGGGQPHIVRKKP